MKSRTKAVLSTIAFATVISLQSYILYQQNQANQTVQVKVDKLQNQIDQTFKANQELLSKIEKLESNLEHKPRSLFSMN
jgi:cell division protein FtsL